MLIKELVYGFAILGIATMLYILYLVKQDEKNKGEK